MQVFENGYKYLNYNKYNKELNKVYDYKNQGLINKLLPERYYKSKNTVFQAVLNLIEKPFINLLKVVDNIANYRSVNWKQY